MLIPFEELFRRHNIKTNCVLHLGANTGQEADAYDKQGIAKVIWVEALPSVYAHLARHIANRPGHVALQACVSDVDGAEVTFNVASNGGQSSSLLEFGTHAQEHPTVTYVNKIQMKTIRVDTLLTAHSIELDFGSFLNIDLQGAELLALRGMGSLLAKFNHVYIEVNEKELYQGCPLVKEIDNYLSYYGFTARQTKMTGSGWGDKYYQR